MLIPVVIALLSAPAFAQSPEVQTVEEAFTFKSKVNLVLVTVVVRDKRGQPVDGLQKQDFQLFEKNQLQEVTKFSVERPGTRTIPQINIEADGIEQPTRSIEAPTQFIAYTFDDFHINFEDMVRARGAAKRHLATASHPGTRFAVYTTSGQVTQEFTDDRDAIQRAIDQLRARPIGKALVAECPDISYYLADLIVNHENTIALGVAAREVNKCAPGTDPELARTIARTAAQRAALWGEQESRIALKTIGEVVRRLSAMPGERTMVLVSPGFITLRDQHSEESSLIDRAARNNVIINSLDARGLSTYIPDISKSGAAPTPLPPEGTKEFWDKAAAFANAGVLADLADGTGGRFFHNDNDLNGAFDRFSGSPSVYYLLGFSPQNLKMDGAFHPLKVRVKEPPGMEVTARRGYYAPRQLSNADDEAKEEISAALFSRVEMNDIPLVLHTQFFKASDTEARLQVSARLDVRDLHFRKSDGTNNDDIIIVSALFDRNGNYMKASSKTLKMKLKDATLQARVNGGVTVRSEFNVPPGTYVIRMVVRDAEGQMMAARNGAVEIP